MQCIQSKHTHRVDSYNDGESPHAVCLRAHTRTLALPAAPGAVLLAGVCSGLHAADLSLYSLFLFCGRLLYVPLLQQRLTHSSQESMNGGKDAQMAVECREGGRKASKEQQARGTCRLML